MNTTAASIVPKSEPRQGWAEAFQALSQEDLNERFFPDVFEDEDLPEDFHRAISMNEAIIRVEKGMRKIINKHEKINNE